MLSSEECREIMAAGLHNDTYFEKMDREESRKTGFKVWGIDEDTSEPYIVERGLKTKPKRANSSCKNPRLASGS